MEAAKLITMFPLELLQAVFDNLSSTDLKSAVLVCKLFRLAGEHKKYWSWVTIQVTVSNLSVIPQVLAFGRLQSMKELCVKAVSQELLKAVDSHPGLSCLDVRDCSVSSVEPKLLAKIISKMEEVHTHAQLTEVQIQEVFNSVSSESKLKRLSILNNDLAPVDSETLARVITAMENVCIHGFESKMTPLQCDTIFKFASSKTNLVELDLRHIDLSSVNPKTLASVVSSLERVVLDDDNLTSQQCKEIFLQLSRDSKVEELLMSDNDLSKVDPELMLSVISKVKILELSSIYNVDGDEFSSQQWKTIFEQFSSDCILEHLDISFNDLEEVDPTDLARIIPNIEKVNLSSTDLCSCQSEAIFKSISCDSKLKKLEMADNNLTSVNPDILAKAITNLEEIDLSYDCYADEENEEDEEIGYKGLSAQQCQVIFQWISQDSKKLKKMNIKGNNLELVDPDTLARLSTNLELNL